MTKMVAMLAVLLLAASVTAAPAASGPFAQPVKDCHPCRFSPGTGQPAFDLTFVFTGSGDERALTAIDIAPASGGTSQRLDTGDVAVSDFADGFMIDDSDMNFDGLGDLSLTTGLFAAGNASAKYWIYEPSTHRFVPLDRSGAGEADQVDRAFQSAANHQLYCHVHSSAFESEDYWYRITGHRAVAVRKEEQAAIGNLLMRTTSDLTVTPPRVMSRHTLGFVGESPGRETFRKLMAEISLPMAAARYKKGDKKGAAAAMERLIGTLELPYVIESYPIEKTNAADMRVVAGFNDYGFYLEEAGRPQEAIAELSAVIDVDPDRMVAYLNLADAYYATGAKAEAKTNYAEYRKRMIAAGKASTVPPRVAERLR